MAAVSELAYLGFEVSDLEAWAEFAMQLLGFDVRPGQGGLELRYDDRAYRILLREGPADDLVFLGWAAPDGESLDAMMASLRAAGVSVEEDPTLASQRRVERLVVFDDLTGNRNELVLGPAPGDGAFESRKIRGGYATGSLGMGHLALTSRTRAEGEAFYCDHLGLRVSDRIRATLPIMELDLVFLRANDRHHSLAIGGPLGSAIHHFMLQMNDLDDIGRTLDRATRAGRLATTLGRHSNDRMVGFYVTSPSGFQVEIGWGGVEVDEATWKVTTYDRIAVWGHRHIHANQEPAR